MQITTNDYGTFAQGVRAASATSRDRCLCPRFLTRTQDPLEAGPDTHRIDEPLSSAPFDRRLAGTGIEREPRRCRSCVVYMKHNRRIERVADPVEGEEAIVRVRG
jgi:hypothetical protein